MSLPGKSVNTRHKIISTPIYPQCKQDWFVSCFQFLNISCEIVSIYIMGWCYITTDVFVCVQLVQSKPLCKNSASNRYQFLFIPDVSVYMHTVQLKLLCKWRNRSLPRCVHLGEISAIKIICTIKQSFKFAKIQLVIKINIIFHSPNSLNSKLSLLMTTGLLM